jgi:hypothetical protein
MDIRSRSERPDPCSGTPGPPYKKTQTKKTQQKKTKPKKIHEEGRRCLSGMGEEYPGEENHFKPADSMHFQNGRGTA